jgi:hypothetical protein
LHCLNLPERLFLLTLRDSLLWNKRRVVLLLWWKGESKSWHHLSSFYLPWFLFCQCYCSLRKILLLFHLVFRFGCVILVTNSSFFVSLVSTRNYLFYWEIQRMSLCTKF